MIIFGISALYIVWILVIIGVIKAADNADIAEEKWSTYLTNIREAVEEYKPCKQDDCSCYDKVLSADFEPFKKGITEDQLQQSKGKGTHYQVINRKLYREEKCMFPARCQGVEHFILNIIGDLPDMEFIMNVRDYPQSPKYARNSALPILSFSKVPDQNFDIMYPAWTFWKGGPAVSVYPRGLGRWDLQRDVIDKEAKKWPFEMKVPQAFFRGSRTSAERDPLVLLAREKPYLVDAQYTKNQAWKSDKDTLGMEPAKIITLEEHCKYKYLFNFRGVAASFRFKHLFLCGSLVFQVGETWQEFFYAAMRPWVHYIPVSPEMKEVEDLLEFVKDHGDIATEIAERGRDFIWDHLRQEDVQCYWRKLLKQYASLMKWKPTLNGEYNQIVKHDEL